MRLIHAYKLLFVAVPLLVLAAWFGYEEKAPDFKEFDAGHERKEAFFNYFVPIIKEENRRLLKIRKHIREWREEGQGMGMWDRTRLQWLADKYRVKDFDIRSDASWQELLHKVDIVPPSLALAQAANESGWGTSRFAVEGNNFYGQWCYEDGCGMVPSSRHADKSHEVAVFSSPGESVRRYMLNLNRNPAYAKLRNIRASLRARNEPISGTALLEGLQSYSERGPEYIRELRAMIRGNRLSLFDDSTPCTAQGPKGCDT